MLTPTSHHSPPPTLCPSHHWPVLCVRGTVSVSCIASFCILKIPHIRNSTWYLSFVFWLTSASVMVSNASMLLPMASFRLLLFHCICVPCLLFPFLCWWIFRLFPYFGYSKQCCNEHWGECILSGHVFPWICPGVGLQDHVVTPFVIFEDSSILFSTLTVSIYCLHSHKQCRGLPLSPYPLPH